MATIYDVILGIYVVELLIRLTAYRWNPREFVKDGWNVFDFIVVVASFVPALRANAMLLRLVRLLRIVRLVRFLPDLRILVAAAGRSMPGIASLAAATFVLIFIYGMLGWVLFADADPASYGNVGQAMVTMFVMLTLENFPDNIAMGQDGLAVDDRVFHQLRAARQLPDLQPVHRHRAEFDGGVQGGRPQGARDRRLCSSGCAPPERRSRKPKRNCRRRTATIAEPPAVTVREWSR